MQFVWLLVRGYASRKGAAGDHAVGAADAELEVGPLMAMPVVRGCGTVLGTHRPTAGARPPPRNWPSLLLRTPATAVTDCDLQRLRAVME